MESEDAEKIVVVKPIPSRPCSNFVAEYPSDTFEACQLNSSAAQTTIAVRPNTLRLKPAGNHLPAQIACSPDDVSDTEICCSSDKVEARRPSVIYKPVAKSVSRNIASFTGNHDSSQQRSTSELWSTVGETSKAELKRQTPPATRSRQDTLSNLGALLVEPLNSSSPNDGREMTTEPLAPSVDRLIYDGYNWRKYGQKQVKGSEYPRSYYKCTHENCQVKKKVERTLDGKIAEIVYNGEHNHPKPLPHKRLQGKACHGNGKSNAELWSTVSCKEKREAVDDRAGNSNEAGISMASIPSDELLVSQGCCVGSPHDSIVHGDNSYDRSGVGYGVYDDPYLKRRKVANHNWTESTATQHSEPDIVVQNPMELDVLGDGFHWRKYGQKVVKGIPYPRSYYKCTHLQCNVRKHVERSSDDPRSVITTYEGKHNHDMPDRNMSSAATEIQFPNPIENTKYPMPRSVG